jgi:putative two-component system response regulator
MTVKSQVFRLPKTLDLRDEAWLKDLRDEVIRHRDFPAEGTPKFIANVFRFLSRLQVVAAPPELAELCIDVSACLFFDGQSELAERAGRLSVEFSVAGAHKSLEARARMLHGTTLLEIYDFENALDELATALELSRLIGDIVRERRVKNNLASVYSDAGEYRKARSIFQELAHEFSLGGDPLSAKLALGNAALAALREGDVENGLALMEAATRVGPYLDETPQSNMWSALSRHTHCMLLIEAGRVADAEALVRNATRTKSQALTTQADTFLTIDSAVVDYLSGRADRNAIFLAIDRARLESPNQYWTALDSAIRTFEKSGEPDLALSIQRKLLEFNKQHKFEKVRRAIGRTMEEDFAASKLALLNTSIDLRVSTLLSIAINQSLRAGYDQTRIFRLSRLAFLFSMSLGSSAECAAQVAFAAKLIDVGNLVVPDELLSKPRILQSGERNIVLEHPSVGAAILNGARLNLLHPCIDAVLYHHEWWNGSGPVGLVRENIPTEARIISLCDAFDAMTHDRPWRRAMTPRHALDLISEQSSKQYDPDLASGFVIWVCQLINDVRDLDEYLGAEAFDNALVRVRQRVEKLSAVSQSTCS